MAPIRTSPSAGGHATFLWATSKLGIILKVSAPTLNALKPGQSGTVKAVAGDGPMRRRLLEMGFVSGTEVRVVRLAPLADPMEVALHGYHLSLRRRDAARVQLNGA